MTGYAWQDSQLDPDNRVAALMDAMTLRREGRPAEPHTRQRHCRITTEAQND